MRFFFYGTLLDGSDNPVAQWVHGKLRAVGPATCRGTLHAIPDPRGWYPALLSGDGIVQGRLYASRNGFAPADLARLDAYEDFDPADPAGSLYLREDIATSSGDAQAYRFNRPLPDGARLIPGGDFRGWLASEGLQSFGGEHGG